MGGLVDLDCLGGLGGLGCLDGLCGLDDLSVLGDLDSCTCGNSQTSRWYFPVLPSSGQGTYTVL